MDRRELELQYAAISELERRERLCPLAKFRPRGRQQDVVSSHKVNRTTLMQGPNKCGKTYVGTALDWACSYGYYIWEVPGLKLVDGDFPPRENVPPEYWVRDGRGLPIPVPNCGMIVTGLARERGIGEVLWPALESHAPLSVREKWKPFKGPGGIVTRCVLPNGSSWLMASTDQDPLTFEGTRIQWAHCDEPVPPFVFNGLWRGLMIDHGKIHFTLTPLGTKAVWMFLKFFCDNPPPSTGIVRLRQEDNPIMTPEARKEFAASLECSEAEYRARTQGDFEAIGNRVIHNFNRKHHVIPARALPYDWISGATYDPHHARPPFIAWWKRSPDGVYHFYREYPVAQWSKIRTGGLTPTEIAILCRNVEGREPAQIRIGDPRFGKSEQSVHGEKCTSWAELMEEAGMPVDTRVPNVGRIETGEQQIVDMLRFDEKFPISPSNTPKILIHDCCKNIIMAFENYGLLLNRDPTKTEEKRSEEWKDPIDVVRYTILYPLSGLVGGGTIDLFSDEDWRRNNEAMPW